MDNISDEIIIKELRKRLSLLLEEDKEADKRKLIREELINKTKLAIAAFDKVNSNNSMEKVDTSPVEGFNYPRRGTWHERIIAYMKYYNKALTISDVVEGIKPFEPKYNDDKLRGSISNMMSSLVKKSEVKKFRGDSGTALFYASPKWFDEKGELKTEHDAVIKEEPIWA